MSRLPIRARLTAAFALAMVIVLAAAAAFVYVRLRADLDEGIDEGLQSRTTDIAALMQRTGPASVRGFARSDESIVQILTPSGSVVAGPSGAALAPAQAAAASVDGRLVERRVEGVEGEARLLVRRVPSRGRPYVLVVGASLEDRDEALSGVVRSFAVGGVAAVLLASGVGYLLATAGLAPVEAMRRRAAQVSLSRADEQLPLPAARDEVRRLGETLNEMLARLRASFDRERRFVADASHELRTPLAVLKTELEAALRTRGHAPDVRESLAAAIEEADHLAQLAEDLLLIARAGDGQLPVRRENVEVLELLERARQRFEDRAREQGRRIRVDAPAGLVASLDPLRIRQALGNLLDNGLRHGSGNLDLTARESDGVVEIDVSDAGAGFPPELAPRAFERFARGDAARGRTGAGLGLAIVSAIADAHGGAATIVEGGQAPTTVRLRVPQDGPAVTSR